MGAVFAVFAGWYYYSPKILGLSYSDKLGQIHFFLFFIGVNLTFFPMHFLGMQGMPRRISDYPDAFAGYNYISSMGSILSAFSLVFFIYILYNQIAYGKVYDINARYDNNAWSFQTISYFEPTYIHNPLINSNIEWSLSNPPALHPYMIMPIQSTISH